MPVLEGFAILDVLDQLLTIRDRRHTGQRYWPLCYFLGNNTVRRQVSVNEALSKLRRVSLVLGQTVETSLIPRGTIFPEPQRGQIEKILVVVGRTERPRVARVADAGSWRRLEAELFRLVLTAERKRLRFALVPMPADLARSLGVGQRALQKSMKTIREQLANRPGVSVHVDLWLGEPPSTGRQTSRLPPHLWMPRLWVSRWRACKVAEAAEAGYLPANDVETAERSRQTIWERMVAKDSAQAGKASQKQVPDSSRTNTGQPDKQASPT